MAFVLGRGFVDMDLETGNFDRGLNRAGSKLRQFDAKLKKFASGAKRVLTGMTAVGFFSVRAGIARQDAIANLEASIESMGQTTGMTKEQLMQFGVELQKATGKGKTEIYNMLAAIHTFGNIGPGVFKRTAMASIDLAAKLKTDLRSAMIQLSKAIEDPTKGLTAMTRSGVSFSKQEQQIIKDLHAANQLFEAQSMILDKVEKQVGGTAAKQNTGLSKSVNEMKEAFDDIKVVLADVFTPALKQLSKVIKSVSDTMESMTPGQKEVAGWGVLGTAITSVTAVIASWGISTLSHAKNLGLIKTTADKAAKSVTGLTQMLKIGKVTYKSTSGEAQVLSFKMGEVAAEAEAAVAPMNTAANSTRALGSSSMLAKTGVTALGTAIGLFVASLINWGNNNKTYVETLEEMVDGFNAFTDQVFGLDDAMKALNKTFDKFIKNMGEGSILDTFTQNMKLLPGLLYDFSVTRTRKNQGFGMTAAGGIIESYGKLGEETGKKIGIGFISSIGTFFRRRGVQLARRGAAEANYGVERESPTEMRSRYRAEQRRRARAQELESMKTATTWSNAMRSIIGSTEAGKMLRKNIVGLVSGATKRVLENTGMVGDMGQTGTGYEGVMWNAFAAGFEPFFNSMMPEEKQTPTPTANAIIGAADAFNRLSTSTPKVAERQRDRQITILEEISGYTRATADEIKKKVAAAFGQ